MSKRRKTIYTSRSMPDTAKNYVPLPKGIYRIGLSGEEIAIYGYLFSLENESYQCWPSYETIGKAVNMSKCTVMKYVSLLEEKHLIRTERTEVIRKDSMKYNGTLRYRRLLFRINQAIGHIKLRDLKSGHLNSFYANLQEEGIRQDTKDRARVDLAAMAKKAKLTRVKLAEKAGLSEHTIRAAFDGKNVNTDSAAKIAKALGVSRSELFTEKHHADTLDANTVRAYHRVISSVLTKAVKWGYIPYNPAANVELPKLDSKEAACLDEADARRLLELLQDEPIKYRAAITFDLLSGLRRGELLGLRWSDVDFTNETVTIVQTSNYVSGKGIYIDSPKNRTSARPLKLSRSVFLVLREYQEWQDRQRDLCGDRWLDRDRRVFTTDEGAPIHPDALSKWFRDFTKRNGFPGVHVHSLRHTYASLMIADGTPLVVVSRRLGHAQVSTTSNIYAHVIASADEKAAQVSEKFADLITTPKKHSATA